MRRGELERQRGRKRGKEGEKKEGRETGKNGEGERKNLE